MLMLQVSLFLLHRVIRALLYDQVYSNTGVPTQVNTNQHEFNTSQHESTRVRHESTRINTSPTRVNSNQHESDTSHLDQETVIVYGSFSW